jgi:hypothetical protein
MAIITTLATSIVAFAIQGFMVDDASGSSVAT